MSRDAYGKGKLLEENFLGANPILPVQAVPKSAKFYEQKLGFEIETLWRNPPYAVVKRGGVHIELGEGRPEHVGSGICYVFVKDVEAIYREFQQRPIDFVGDLADRDYGQRDFRLRDLDGNMLIVGSESVRRRS